MASSNGSIQECIQACLHCYQSCQSNAMGLCLEQGGQHVAPGHMRLMISCAEVCRAAAAVMLNQSPQHPAVCRACAELCEACARSCEQVGGMGECAQACRRCAESCRTMAA
ncbi:four-helix bundle copper-binding protein [Frateuria sp.]|uniref:four-helix bundle copper-binding protein n=1 Tax=Frateuria sp. TaxID=2211372 RepID=UPI0017F45CA9|nr:four-helix bundle copper-binding protein [Frateuria sp.]NUR23923.1 four-helix bundle copper-binding protein [Frateuria sp.]